MRRCFSTRPPPPTSVLTHEHVLQPMLKRQSLIPETLAGMTVAPLSPKERRRQLPTRFAFTPELTRSSACEVFQINIGRFCNQACSHCHVEASPRRRSDQMTRATVDRCLHVISNTVPSSIRCVDITGGAPELHDEFRYLVQQLRSNNKNKIDIIDRCNLTVLTEPGQEDLGDFLRDHQVSIVASLPCYGEKNVDLQRGRGVFSRSIAALQHLNALGYGSKKDLRLDLVYNPVGPFLPPPQRELELQYKRKLKEDFGIEFNNLFCLTNMPIKRFADVLHRRGELERYMDVLLASYNPATLGTVMCKNTVSVKYDGQLFDCDFNQQLDLPVKTIKKRTVFDVDSANELVGARIATASHCYACTASKGSSCQGEVVVAG